ncbi:unnamed protein product [Plasmodium vivax]|uniref:(malaria parasite P. vivax) hypothetical protein n=1 Tax=Plasmodium vivax TaxID=5855 RepID=A0A8S4HG50_PLAVI|nr:unnamed protein product [Plasmodium vivax]
MGINHHNESTRTVGATSQAQTPYVISQNSGKEKRNKIFLPQIVKITPFVVLIWACRFSSEDDLQTTSPWENVKRCCEAPFSPGRPSRVLKNKPEPTAEEILSKRYCKKSKTKSKDKHMERKLSAFLNEYASTDELYEEESLYSLTKCNCEEMNAQTDDVLRRFYPHHSKKPKFGFIKDLVMLVTIGMLVGAITCAAMSIWVPVFPLILGFLVGIKAVDAVNER